MTEIKILNYPERDLIIKEYLVSRIEDCLIDPDDKARGKKDSLIKEYLISRIKYYLIKKEEEDNDKD